MRQSRVAERYAKALLDLSNDENQTEEVDRDIRSFEKNLQESRDLELTLDNPIVATSKKVAIFKELYQNNMNPITFGFLNLVLQKRRESNFKAIAQSFIDLYDQQKGITKVEITTAVPATDSTINDIITKIKNQKHVTEVDVVKKVDPSIIGGFIAEFGNKILDNSVENNLNKIKRRLGAI